ncbi:MAG TPA: acetylxylan esterase [Vicinamibacteria bacterium]|nr:acetylxylan esterase [Vicinamibacteria bacterium]
MPLLVVGALVSAGPIFAADVPAPETLQVLEPEPEGPLITPFLTYQVDRAWAKDAARQERFAAVKTEADLRTLQDELRGKALALIGGLPAAKTPLATRVTGTIPMEGYRIEKLVFESLPGLHVTALVYVPDGPAGRKPAVLVACGHSPVGKAHPGYQEIAARLARRGYVVLCWDPVGQGERSQFWDRARGRSRYNLVCGEHAVLGNFATIAGTSLVRYMVWDGMRAVDYLLTRDDVDPAKIAITGTSGGGFQALWIGGLDPRIAVVLPSCFPTALPMRMANRIFEDPDSDPEQDPPGLVSEGIDHPGLLLLSYPRPLHVSAAVLDFFPIEGTRKSMREVAAFYRRFGHGGRAAISEGYHRHQYSAENQARTFAFLDRAFRRPAVPNLGDAKTLPGEALRCTPTGQVREDLSGRSLLEIIREDTRARPPKVLSIAELYRGEGYPGIRQWPAVPFTGAAPLDAIAWQRSGTGRVGAAIVDRYRLLHSGGLVVPLVHVRRDRPRSDRVVLRVSLEGKIRPGDWKEVESLLADGHEVVSFDPRGLGETRMRYKAASIDDPDLAPADEEAAYLSPLSGVLANHVYNAQLLGRPYLLEMIEDVEIVSRFVRSQLGAREVAIDAPGEARLLGRAVAAALPDVGLVVPARLEPSFSWKEAVESLRETWPIQYLLPGGAALRLDAPGGGTP